MGLRINRDAVGFVASFVATGKPVTAICRGPWPLIEADVVRGHRLTAWPSLWTDLRNAGAQPVDQEVVVDGWFISSCSPADLAASCPRCRTVHRRPAAELRGRNRWWT
ncbi:DJ-1/PfpI family protein [Pseudonocardia sp. NPDC049154]|uniref:DJ-1/PfpI family protein n=1 Tax=Pseudonocardia sp. NPDC049154 TaxID=3155501 RepID=UPI0033C0258E